MKQAEVAYAEGKKGTLKALEKMKKETLDKLETLSDSAIDWFMDTLALQSADLLLDVEMGLSEVELDLFTTLAHVIPSLCLLGTTTTLHKPDQLQGDLVGAKEFPTPENREADREKAV